MYMAKNESEFCQIAVRSNKARGSSFIRISDFTDKNGNVIPAEIYYEFEVSVPQIDDFYYMPDPLIPMGHECKYYSKKETNNVFAIIVKTDENSVPGDGYLVYPVVKGMGIWANQYAEHSFNKNEIFSTLRLESIMSGVEDYDYLKLAENLIGKYKTDKILHKVTTSLTEFTYSDSTFAKARIELGNAIEKASR